MQVELSRYRADVAHFLLVHSPLVGPSSWTRVAAALRARGRDVVVPDLTGVAARRERWGDWFVDAAVAGCDRWDGDVVVVGHSGAGVFLPHVADRLADRCAATIFVDAVVPAATGEHRTSASLLAKLDEVDDDGVLRPWLTWWPDEDVSRLLPDADDRAALSADMPRLPRAFYDEPVAVPDGWIARPNGYLQLSPAYDGDRARAEEHGWPTARLDATHLSTFTAPADVAAAIETILARRLA